MTADKSAAPERLETLLRALITEQSCGEWADKTIEADVQKFLPSILALFDTPAPPTTADVLREALMMIAHHNVPPEEPLKGHACKHGRSVDEDCNLCTAAFARATLAAMDTPKGEVK